MLGSKNGAIGCHLIPARSGRGCLAGGWRPKRQNAIKKVAAHVRIHWSGGQFDAQKAAFDGFLSAQQVVTSRSLSYSGNFNVYIKNLTCTLKIDEKLIPVLTFGLSGRSTD